MAKPIKQRYVDQVRLNASGNGSIEFTMRGDFLLMVETWSVVNSANVNGVPTKQSTAITTIDGFPFEGTYSGNQDSSNTGHMCEANTVVRCDWTGGDANAIATFTLRGIEYPAGEGMKLYDSSGGAGGPPGPGSGPSNPILGGTVLIRDAIKSRNFVAGVSGWQIATTGNAEFNAATIRGTLSADNGNVLVNDAGLIITGTQQKVSILDSGLYVEELPLSTGAQVLLAGAAGFGGIMFLRPENSAVGGILFVPGAIYSGRDETLTDSRPYIKVMSPAIDSTPDLHTAQLVLHGQLSSSGTDDSYAEIIGSALQVNGMLNLGNAGAIPEDQVAANTNNGTTTSTTFVNSLTTTGIHGTTFVAPPSGSVYVIAGAVAANNTAGSYAILDWEIRTGGVVGSGTVWRAATDLTAGLVQSGTANNQGTATAFGIATGLTPGSTYNACVCYHAATSGTAAYDRRHITVIPMLNS